MVEDPVACHDGGGIIWFFWRVGSILLWLRGVRVVGVVVELGGWVVVVLVDGSGGCALVWGLCFVECQRWRRVV